MIYGGAEIKRGAHKIYLRYLLNHVDFGQTGRTCATHRKSPECKIAVVNPHQEFMVKSVEFKIEVTSKYTLSKVAKRFSFGPLINSKERRFAQRRTNFQDPFSISIHFLIEEHWRASLFFLTLPLWRYRCNLHWSVKQSRVVIWIFIESRHYCASRNNTNRYN